MRVYFLLIVCIFGTSGIVDSLVILSGSISVHDQFIAGLPLSEKIRMSAPTEQPGMRRTHEIRLLYGDQSHKVRSLLVVVFNITKIPDVLVYQLLCLFRMSKQGTKMCMKLYTC